MAIIINLWVNPTKRSYATIVKIKGTRQHNAISMRAVIVNVFTQVTNGPKQNNIQSKRKANYGKDETNHQGKKNNNDNNNNKKIKTNHPKKRGIKQVKSELSDHESDFDDEDDESDDEGDEESAYVITKSIRAVKNMDDNMAIIDTGADESCFKSEIVRKRLKLIMTTINLI